MIGLLSWERVIKLIEIKNVTKKYDGKAVLSGVNLTIHEGERIAFVGESGSGKTTLAKLIVGLLKPDEGEIYLSGNKLDVLSKRDFFTATDMQYVFQDPYSALEPTYTIKKTLEETIRICKRNKREVMGIDEALHLIDQTLLNRLSSKVQTLSGGQRQKLCIARAILPKPSVIIADECTSMLDEVSNKAVLALLNDIQQKQKMTLISIMHEVNFEDDYWDTIVVFKDGEVVEKRAFSEFVNSATHPYSQSLIKAYKYYKGSNKDE